MIVLDPDLTVLLDSVASPLVRARPITGLRVNGVRRATYRLTFSDGSTLKGRVMDSEEHAARVFDLAHRLDAQAFPQPLARHGTALLEPWINGRHINAIDGAELFGRIGAILGGVHAVPATLPVDELARWDPERRLADIQQRLDSLVALGLLDRRRAGRLTGVARESIPGNVTTGVIHRDLWPRNVIVDDDGAPWVVDNGNVALGAHAFDLARAEYLWPMSPELREAFLVGYEEAAVAPADPGPFWAIDVRTEVALFRKLSGTRGVSRPLGGLRQLASAA